mgnify:CR=1 FL=1|jgi:hypothetical protein
MTDRVKFIFNEGNQSSQMILYIDYGWRSSDGRIWAVTSDEKIYVIPDEGMPIRADIRVVSTN